MDIYVQKLVAAIQVNIKYTNFSSIIILNIPTGIQTFVMVLFTISISINTMQR